MATFPTFFLRNTVKENVFYNILERKNAFQAIKAKSSKSRKIYIFPKGITHHFGPKMASFPPFFFQAVQARKMSFTIFQNEKTPFQAIETRSSKSRKIDISPKGLTHGLSPKMAIFPTFLLANIGQENAFYHSLKRKATFQGIKTRSSKNRKIDIFPKGITHGFGPKMAILATFFFGTIGKKKF